ncbi:hypothetical protein OE749_17520 [Aestuariibacter sp. AA17]|uniref:Uncharacterized protein n=1 Tax=Fluctibacter corallii TaxID=2984329 RepID=A0ABT3ACV3_9ALTE|nr:hypothetical protein [Aestuariibacter sp. AA17]MCV2886499.1 hypothetical protein [Aestuariibacter sp. AA17]
MLIIHANITDPNGEAKVYTWNAGATATGKSRAGHAAFVGNDGTYLSMFPKDGSKFSSPAEFHTYEQDLAIYGRAPDMIFDVGLTDEAAAINYAKGLKADVKNQIWDLENNNCATVTVNALNAGGTNLPTNNYMSPVQVDAMLNIGADAPKGSTAIPVVCVSGRIESRKLDEASQN